jgi:hypothetical protein
LRQARLLVSLQPPFSLPSKELNMPRLTCRVLLLTAATAWIFIGPARATSEAEELPAMRWSAEAGIGVEYDSNVSVEELDRSSNQGDYALTLDAGIALQQQLSPIVEAGLTYDFSQTIYDKFSQVDRQTHILGADLGLDFARFDPGFSLFYIISRLDGDSFLELYRASPSISGFLAKKWFARVAYVYADKTINDREGRDAKTNSGEADVYFFLRGLRRYFNMGYRFKHENARADPYDYTSNSVKLRYIQRFELFSRITKLEFAWRYEDRNYRSDTPGIGEKRQDERNRFRLDYEIPVLEKAAVQFFAGFSDYSSNYPPAAYDQTLVGTRIVYTW